MKTSLKQSFNDRIKNCLGVIRLSALTCVLVGAAWTASANNQLWIGTNDVTTDTNWSDNANWQASGAGGAGPNGNSDFFGPNGAAGAAYTVNNVVDQNGLNPFSLTFTNATGQFHTTYIPSGVSVVVATTLSVGGGVVPSAATCNVTIEGPGALTTTNLTLNGIAASSTSTMQLDMSQLNGFTNNSPSSTMTIGTVADMAAALSLASNSFVNVGTINLETTGGSNGRNGNLNLGATTNTIWANNINIGTGKAATVVVSFTNTTGAAAIAGTNGTARANIVLASDSSGTAAATGSLLLAGHLANVLAGTITLAARNNTGGGADSGTVTIDNGTFDATSIIMGTVTSGTASGTIGAQGTFILGGNASTTATLIVNSPTGPGGGSLVLGKSTNSASTGNGTLTINTNSTAEIYCSITRTNAAGSIATLNINGGTLNMEGATNTIGTAAVPINNVNLTNATMQLFVVDGATTPVINAGTVTGTGTNTLNISVSGLTGVVNIPLIAYTGTDPTTNSFVVNGPANYVSTLVDDGASLITLNLVPVGVKIYPLLWVGAVGNTINGNWNYTSANWSILTNGSSQTYTNPDDVTFDDSSSNSTVTLTANFTPGSITFSNGIAANPVTGLPLAYTLTGPGSINGPIGLLDANQGSVTLQESGGDSFTGGIVIGANGTVVLDDANSTISGDVSIGSGATLQIGNNDTKGSFPGNVVDNGTLTVSRTDSVVVSNTVSGAGAFNQAGSGVLTLTANNSAYTGSLTASAGTLVLTNSGSIANASSVTIGTGAAPTALNISGVTSGGVTSMQALNLDDATVTLGTTNQSPPLTVVNGVVMSGNVTVNVTALPPLATYPSTVILVQASSLSEANPVSTGTLPAGYSGTVGTSGNDIVVTLASGPVGQRPYVVWSGADLVNNDTNWTDNANWELAGAPIASDNVIFNETGSVSSSAYSTPGGGAGNFSPANINNIVNANVSVSTLNYTNLGASYQNTYIDNGATLTVTNSMAIGSSSTDFGSSASEFVTMSGTNGTLAVKNTNSTFFVGLVTAGGGSEQATLDMSGLGTFNASVSSFGVGAVATTAFGTIATTYLAETNNITAVGGSPNEGGQDETLGLMVGETGKNGAGTCYLYLGQENTISVNSIGVSLAKEQAQMLFNQTLTASSANPTATFYGTGGVGTPVSQWSIGDGLAQSGGSTTPNGTVDFTGGTVNALVSTMYIGRNPNASGGVAATGTLTFGAGTISAQTVYAGYQANSNTDWAIGNMTVNGTGIFQVGTLNMSPTAGGTGAASTASTLTINGGTVDAGTIVGSTPGQSTVTLENSGTLVVSNTAGTPAAPLTTLNLDGGTLTLSPINGGTNIVATTVSTSGTTTINIASVVNASGSMQIPLLYYGSSTDPYSSLALGTTPLGFTSPGLVDDTAHQTIDLAITAPPVLQWVGALSTGALDGNWNTSDQNWSNGVAYVAYANPDGALFTDSASNFVVNLTTALTPYGVTVNNSVSNYAFIGSGSLSGSAFLNKQGGATLTLDNSTANSYGGGTTISTGTLQIGNNDANGSLGSGTVTDNGALVFDQTANSTVGNNISGSGTLSQIGTSTVTLSGNSSFTGGLLISNGVLNATSTGGLGATASAIVVTNGGTFDDNGLVFNGAAAHTLIVSGAGYNGAGAIINSGAQQVSAFSNITVAANVTFGATNRWDLRAGAGTNASLNMSPAGSPYSITKVGTNEVSLVNVGTIDAGLGNIFVQQGELGIQLGTAQLGNPASNIVVSAGATLEMFGATTPLNKVITFNGGANDSFKSDSSTSNQNVVIGPVTLNGNCLIDVTGTAFATFDNVISGGGGMTVMDTGTLTLTNAETYFGNTVINAGTLVLTGLGSIGDSVNISVAAGAVLNDNNLFTLNSGQTLSGSGTVLTNLSASANSTVAPGTNGITGVLTVSGSATLNGNTLMKLNTTTNDVLASGTTVTYGGTLTLTNISATPLALGNSFKLFNAGAYSGTFSSIVTQPPLAAGLSWANSGSGVFTIVSTSGPTTNANITHVSFSGTNMLIHGTNNNVPNTSFHYAVLVSTNVATPLTNWTPIVTNSFNPDGTFDYTNPIVPGTPRQFIDVKAVP